MTRPIAAGMNAVRALGIGQVHMTKAMPRQIKPNVQTPVSAGAAGFGDTGRIDQPYRSSRHTSASHLGLVQQQMAGQSFKPVGSRAQTLEERHVGKIGKPKDSGMARSRAK